MHYHVELTGPQGTKVVVVRANHHADAVEAAVRANPGMTFTGRFAAQQEPGEATEAEVVEESDEE